MRLLTKKAFIKWATRAASASENEPARGIEFAGRLTEDFKLSSATWVHVGALRVRALAALASVAEDIVIAGHDRDEIGFLVFPKTGVGNDPASRERVRQGLALLRAEGCGSSTYATRAILLTEPPSIDAGEITDKGYINQRAVIERRAAILARLYRNPPYDEVIVLED